MTLTDLIEYTIEFAWQIGDTEDNIPRAESRWKVLEEVLKFTTQTKDFPEEDIDEFVQQYLTQQKP